MEKVCRDHPERQMTLLFTPLSLRQIPKLTSLGNVKRVGIKILEEDATCFSAFSLKG